MSKQNPNPVTALGTPLPPCNHRARLPVLDGLRAVAILLILSLHITDHLYMHDADGFLPLGSQPFKWFLMNGWVGVQLFFVLSGFLITRQLRGLEQNTPRRTVIMPYIRHRLCRIVPAYYVVLAFIFGSILIHHYPLSPQGASYFIQESLAYLSFSQDIYNSRIGEAFVLWSLATEVKFYLLAPLLVIGLSYFTHIAQVLMLAATMIGLLALKIVLFKMTGGSETYLDFFMDIRRPFYMAVDGLVMGMLCHYIASSRTGRRFITHRIAAPILYYGGSALVIGVMALTVPYWHQNNQGLGFFQHSFLFTLIAFGFGAVLLGLLGQAPGYRIFESPVLRFIALISYSLYLLHTFFVPLSIRWASAILGVASTDLILWLISTVILLGVTAVPASLLYYFVERPAIAWSKKE